MTNELFTFAVAKNATFSNETFAKELKVLLADPRLCNKSRRQLADEIGIGSSTLDNLLNGTTKISADILQNLITYFNDVFNGDFNANRLFGISKETADPTKVIVTPK